MKNRSRFLCPARMAASQFRSNSRQTCSIFALFFLVVVSISSPVQASLISLHSTYGLDTITLDTDTGLEWLDVGAALTYQGNGSLRSYNSVVSELGIGGLFEGFRYAVRSEVEALLYDTFGFDPVTSSSSSTVTTADKAAAGSLMSMLDYTLGWDHGGGAFSKVLDAVFDDENPDSPAGAMYVFFGVDHASNLTGGKVTFYQQQWVNSNTTPYGHFLVRDSAINVDEPPMLSLALMAVMMFGWSRRRAQTRIRQKD